MREQTYLKKLVISSRSNLMELQVQAVLSDFLNCESLTTFKTNVEQELKKNKRVSTAKIEHQYQLVYDEELQEVRVYHNITKKRLIAVITKR